MSASAISSIKLKYIFKVVLFSIVFTAMLVAFSFFKNLLPTNFERLAHGTLGTLAALLTTVLFLKYDKKRFSNIGLNLNRKTPLKFFTGVVIGIAIMGLLAISVIYVNDLKVTVNSNSNVLYFLLMTLPLLPLAFMEELAFRGYPLEMLKHTTGIRLSIIVTSILFALYHVVNGWSVAASFYGPGVWGLIFGLAAVYSKGIAMPTGIHYSINLTTSSLGEKNTTASIWILEQPAIAVVEQTAMDWGTILPALSLFVFAIICIEVYMRRATALNVNSNNTI